MILAITGFPALDSAFAQQTKYPMMFKMDPSFTIITNGISITSSSSSIPEKEPVTITGKFVLGGKPAPDRTITLTESTSKQVYGKTLTDKNGQFAFTLNLAFQNTPYTFVASYDYIDVTYTSNEITISVLPGAPTLNLSSRLVVEGYPVTFYGDHVVNGQPQANSQIQIVDKTHNTVIGTTTTDGNGKYSLSWIPQYSSIPYEFYAVAPFQKLNNISDILRVQVHRVSFTIDASATSVTEGSPVIFSGSIFVDGRPASGIQVTVFEQTGQAPIPVGTAMTDDSGAYSVLWNAVFTGQPSVFFASTTQPTASIVSSSGFEFQSNLIKLMVLQQAEPIVELTLEKLPQTIMEGETLEFSGNASVIDALRGSSTPIPNIPVCIFDEATNQLVSSGTTDSNGEYAVLWKSIYREDAYSFYAAHFQDCSKSKVDIGRLGGVEPEQYFWTNPYKVAVYEFPELVLRPVAEAVQGDVIDIVGFTAESLAGQKANAVIDGMQFSSVLDERGVFSLGLDSSQIKPGSYKAYLQCPCNGLNLQSNTQVVTISPANPLDASISPLINQSGGVPVSVTFDSDVIGGSPPYRFSWYIDRDLSANTESFTQPITDGDAYTVTLIVADSAGTRASDVVSVSTGSRGSQGLGVSMEVKGELAEGAPLTFSAIIDSTDYPFAIEETRWSFGDGTGAISDESGEVTKTFEENGLYEIVLTVADENRIEFSERKELFIENRPPQILPHQKESTSFDGAVRLEARFTDPGTKDTFTINWLEGDRILYTSQQNNAGIVSAELPVEPGRHTIRLAVFDDDGSADSTEFTITEYVPGDPDPTGIDDPLLWVVPAVIVAAGAGVFAVRWNQKGKKGEKKGSPVIEVDFRGGIR